MSVVRIVENNEEKWHDVEAYKNGSDNHIEWFLLRGEHEVSLLKLRRSELGGQDLITVPSRALAGLTIGVGVGSMLGPIGATVGGVCGAMIGGSSAMVSKPAEGYYDEKDILRIPFKIHSEDKNNFREA